tara:strand:- start:371 stop:487 length:117 start_codon:yes stop_codon:yes gene_type:complete
MATKKAKKQAELKEEIIGAFKNNKPKAISFFNGKLVKK